MQDFRDLKVWQKAHRLTIDVYRATAAFPADERCGLTGQLRRKSASIGANLAEGCCRHTDRDFARFVDVALGSAGEVEDFLLLARDLGVMAVTAYEPLELQIREIKMMLSGLKQRLRGKDR